MKINNYYLVGIFAILIIGFLAISFSTCNIFIHNKQQHSTHQTSQNQPFFKFLPLNFHQTPEEFDDDITDVLYAQENERTQENKELFQKTDLDVVKPFYELFQSQTQPVQQPFQPTQHKNQLILALLHIVANNPLLHLTTLLTKLYYNRARPCQLATSKITHLPTKTAHQTPSYPSSHALQAFAISKCLTKLYPEKSKEIKQIAERIADIRKIGGVHFKSDKEFARRLAHNSYIFWI